MSAVTDLLAVPRIKITAALQPLAGTRFQPTGFPDLGAATYPSPTVPNERLLLVESAQSMANRLEATLWNDADSKPDDAVIGLSYVRIVDPKGEYLTSSRTESHRVASAYVKDARFGPNEVKGLELMASRMALVKDRPIDHARVHEELFALDPMTLVFGVFMADKDWPGQPKVARAVTAFVEAAGVMEAYSGGVKFDHVSNTGDKGGAKEGYGNVPFARTEYVARSIDATFIIDTAQIASYRLDSAQREVVLAVALLAVRRLLDGGLRLRTACDLEVTEIRLDRPIDGTLPSAVDLESTIRDLVDPSEPLVGKWS